MVPSREAASSGYALVDPGREYLVYLLPPEDGAIGRMARRLPDRLAGWLSALDRRHAVVEVDLSPAVRPLTVEWADPGTGETVAAPPVPGGGRRALTAPFPGPAVLHLTARGASEPGPRVAAAGWQSRPAGGRTLP
jgi:hypothetical protein